MALNTETRRIITDIYSPRFRRLVAPEVRVSSDQVIHLNQGRIWGQRATESILGIAANLHVSGMENLASLRAQLRANEKSPDQKTGVWVTINHAGHLDFPKTIEGLAFGGEELRRRAIIAMGSRVAESFFVDLGTRQYQWVRTPQPYEEAVDGKLTEDQLVQRTREDMILLRQSKEALRYAFGKGMFGVIAPTGTRKANHEGIPAVTGYLKGNLILPAYIEGSGKILPPGEWRPHRGTVKITFGEMYPFSEIEQSCRNLPRDEQRKAEINMVMDRIAALAPAA